MLKINNILRIPRVLNYRQKQKAVLLLFVIFIATILETVGIGLIIPFLALIVDPNIIEKYAEFTGIVLDSSKFSHNFIIMIATSTMAMVYILKAIYLTYKAKVQASYVYKLQADLSNRLFSDYIYKPYTFHLQENSSKLIHNILGEVNSFITVVVSGLTLLSEVFVVVGLVILMFIVNIQVALGITFLFGAFSLVTYIYYKEKLYSLGRKRQIQERLRHKHLQQGFGGIKEIKMFGSENNFISRFGVPTNNLITINTRHQVSLEMPRVWLETFVVIVFFTLVAILIVQTDNIFEVIPVLGMFAAIGIRVMPSIARIIFNIQQLKFYGPTIEVIFDEFSNIKDRTHIKEKSNNFDFNKEIILNNIFYSYPESNIQILHNISVKIHKNSLVGIVGLSGAGKSTLTDIILGMIKPDKGIVKVDGVDIHSNIRVWQNHIGYIPQTVYLTDDSIKSNIAFGVNIDDIDDILLQQAIISSQLETFVSSLPDGVETLVGEYGSRISGGQRQRIGIARALYNNPDVLVMDEATSALDKITEKQLMKVIKDISQSKTVVFVTHRESIINYCDKVLMLENGNLTEVHN
jgi:ABC-type multidrug transport system fused ATPase/permease subunit